nr:hypothetical protein [Halomonas sp.]
MRAHRRLNTVKADDHISSKVSAIVEAGGGAVGFLLNAYTAFAKVGDALRQIGDNGIQKIGTMHRGLANTWR